MAIEFKYSRFANLADMTAFAVKVAIAHNESAARENKAFAESGIYSDNSDLSHRVQISIVCDNVVHVLRWNAFCDQPDIEHMGKRSRREARDAADWFTNQIQEAFNAAAKDSAIRMMADDIANLPMTVTVRPAAAPINPARAALSRAVNRAIENGAPVIAEIPYWERPCAAAGLISYRCRSPYGFVMIGAKDDDDAMKQALRSTSKPEALERWNGAEYVAVERPPLQMTCKRCEAVNPTVYFAPVAVSASESICTCLKCADAAGFLTKSGDIKPGYSL
jgi:hypothetical protein